MKTTTITKARSNLYKIADAVNESHEPYLLTGKNASVVMIGADDWNALNETLYLLNIPGMRESILEGMKADIKTETEKLDW